MTTHESHQLSWPSSADGTLTRWQDAWSNNQPPLHRSQSMGKSKHLHPVAQPLVAGRSDKGLPPSTSQWTLNRTEGTQLVVAQKVRQRLTKQDKQFLFRTQSVPHL